MADVPAEMTLLQTLDTTHYADSVEWCPLDGYQDLLLCGTYQLQDGAAPSGAAQHRIGQLNLYTLTTVQHATCLSHTKALDMPGILDIKWSHHKMDDNRPMFAVVNSTGQLLIGTIDTDEAQKQHLVMSRETCVVENGLGLSLDWSKSDVAEIVSSDSTGQLTVSRLAPDDVKVTHQWTAHEYEAWICAFDCWNKSVIYSGGDDCKLHGWDLRSGVQSSVFTSTRHSAGVCSIQSNPCKENLLATGSYDDHVLIWDNRQMKRPLRDADIGGGVWRIKWDPWEGTRILTATMYNGFHVMDSAVSSDVPSDSCVLNHHLEPGTVTYGADWCRCNMTHNIPTQPRIDEKPEENTDVKPEHSNDSNNVLIATCSFYDHSLKLWRWNRKVS